MINAGCRLESPLFRSLNLNSWFLSDLSLSFSLESLLKSLLFIIIIII